MSTYDAAVLILGLGVGLTFAAHGAQKAFGWWGGPGLAGWRGALEHMGFRPVGLFAVASVGAELGAGLALAVGFLTPVAAAILVAQTLVIIFHVHWPKGFWNGKGGIEFPLVLGLGAAALGLLDPGMIAVDHALGLTVDPTVRFGLLIAGLVVGLASLAIPRLSAGNGAASAAS
jgi:putative oxidoreductase